MRWCVYMLSPSTTIKSSYAPSTKPIGWLTNIRICPNTNIRMNGLTNIRIWWNTNIRRLGNTNIRIYGLTHKWRINGEYSNERIYGYTKLLNQEFEYGTLWIRICANWRINYLDGSIEPSYHWDGSLHEYSNIRTGSFVPKKVDQNILGLIGTYYHGSNNGPKKRLFWASKNRQFSGPSKPGKIQAAGRA